MLRKTLFVLCLVCVALLLGCNKSETTNNSNSMSNSNKTMSDNSASSTTNTSSSSSASSGEKIGIAECDEFIAAYDACVSKKVPEAVRAQYKASIDQWRASWRKAAANPTSKAALASQCKQIAEQQKSAMKPFGCTF